MPKKVTKKAIPEVDARYKQDSKKGTYHVYNIDKNDPDWGNKEGIVGGIYIPTSSPIPKQIIINLGGTISDR